MSYRRLIAVSFFLNGVTMVGMKAVSEFGLARVTPMVLFSMYGTSSLLGIFPVVAAGRRPQRRSLWVGAIAGIASIAGCASSIGAAALAQGYVVFPVISGGSLLLVAVFGRIAFGEKIGPYGLAGIAVGIAGIAMLGG